MAVKVRPLGVTILAILEVLGGLVFLGIGALMLIAASLVTAATVSVPYFPFAFPAAILAAVLLVYGAVLAILGIFAFVIAYGLWTGKGWAWTLAIILAIIAIIMGLISLPSGIVTILINVIIIYYLTRPHVKEFFGKAVPLPPPPPPL